ncbi:hypothetical protein F4804DRAFT_18275 [Jackrogersella minutella]|nr:hypothetical protein F4804DRAFT_18275 [Jackrogersella minutella]
MKASTVVLLSAITSTSAWRDFKAIEFESDDCTGWVKHASLGLKPEYWQIHMNNLSNSVYTSTTNDGIYRWYAYSEKTELGCGGKALGRLYSGCMNLGAFTDRIQCIRWCSRWMHDEYSCKAIGQD